MKKSTIFSALLRWYHKIKWPEHPKKRIAGKWQLFEYYMDKEDELLHFDEGSLKSNKVLFFLSFLENNELILTGNSPVELLNINDKLKWSISRNYLYCNHSGDVNYDLKFQFAFNKGDLKLLKKDKAGKIEFFGFFRKVVNKTMNDKT